jgi:hypothetical protein
MFVSVGDESAGVDVLYCSQEGVWRGKEKKEERKLPDDGGSAQLIVSGRAR